MFIKKSKGDYMIEIKHVTKKYGNNVALDDVSFDEKFLILVKSSVLMFAFVGSAFCDFLRNLCLATK